MEVKDIQGNILIDALVTEQAVKTDELMKQHSITLSWVSVTDDELPLSAYIEHEGVRYSLLTPYKPEQSDETTFAYKPVFHHPVMRWQHLPFFHYTYSGGSIVSKEPDWSLTDNAANFMAAVCAAIKEQTGEDWRYEIADNLPASASLSFSNTDIFSGLTSIAGKFETEWWFDYESKTIYLSKASHGSEVSLEVGRNIGIPSTTQSRSGYATRFYVFGSTRNIEQNYAGSNVNSIVNKRLTLNPAKYPNGYIDIREGLTDSEILVKTLTFDDVYPRSMLTISNVKVRLMWRLDSDNQKVQIGTDADGKPVYDQYAIWYFKIPGLSFNKDMVISGKVLSVHFNDGPLQGREFDLTYHDVAKDVETSDGTSIRVDAGDFEINFIEEGTYIIPAMTGLVPVDGNNVSLFNIVMPEEYKASAYEELEKAALKEIAKQGEDMSNYSFSSNAVEFFMSNPALKVGRKVTYKNGDYTYSTRVIKLETQLDRPYEQKITIGNEQIKGNTQTLKEEVVSANQNIDLISAINESTQQLMQSYQRTQKALLDSMSKWGNMWRLDAENNAVYTPLNMIVGGTLAMGDLGEGGSETPVAGLQKVSITIPNYDSPFVSDAAGNVTLPAYPTALKNPYALTINGHTYDGSKAVNITINGGGGIADSVDWVNVTNKPTTLAGYGITDALSKSGGTITTGDIDGFSIYRNNSNRSAVHFFNTQDGVKTDVGYLGVIANLDPVYINAGGSTYHLIHSSNYSNYALPLSGGTMANNAGISWTNNVHSWNAPVDGLECISTLNDTLGYYAGLSYKGFYGLQIRAYGGNTDLIQVRGFNHTDWGTWRNVIHSGNYSSYALPLSGGTIESTSYYPLILNTTKTNNSAIIYNSNKVNKAQIGWSTNVGTFLLNYSSNCYLGVKDDGTPYYMNSSDWVFHTLIHSGNIGSQTANAAFELKNYGGRVDNANVGIFGDGALRTYLCSSSMTSNRPPFDGTIMHFAWDNTGGYEHQLSIANHLRATPNERMAWRAQSAGTWGEWKSVAFTDSNVASATKLQTARTIWGQSFDGAANVSGDIHLNTSAIYWYSDKANYCIESVSRSNASPYLKIAYYGGIHFHTQGTERMRIADGGNVIIGTTTNNGQKLQVYNTSGWTSLLYTNNVNVYLAHEGGYGFAVDSANENAGTFLLNLMYGVSNGGKCAMRVNDNGNVLIGTTTDNGAKLQVEGTLSVRRPGDLNSYFNISVSDIQVLYRGYDLGDGYVYHDFFSNDNHIARFDGRSNRLVVYNHIYTPTLRFIENSATSISTSAGYLSLVSNSNEMCFSGQDNATFYINYRTSHAGKAPAAWVWCAGSSNSRADFELGNISSRGNLTVIGGATFGGDVWTEGTMAMAKLASSSDRKLKDNIAEVSAKQSMSIIRQLRPTTWNWKKDGKKSYGLIAQEVAPIVPEMVVDMGHLHLEYNQLHAFEIGAIKHIDSEVEQLKKDLKTANNRIKGLENKLNEYRRTAQWQ